MDSRSLRAVDVQMGYDTERNVLDVTMPKASLAMDEGVVVDWYAEVGDSVAEGAVLALIESDKLTAEVECPASGRLTEILVACGGTARVGDVLARLARRDAECSAVASAESRRESPGDSERPSQTVVDGEVNGTRVSDAG